jgi:predicted TIM-barrel fold metal-dependent hydrolase
MDDKSTEFVAHDEHSLSKLSWLPRRRFLGALGTLAAGALVPGWAAQTPKNQVRGFDWHHHFGPPQWSSFLSSKNVLFPGWRDWTPAKSIEELDQAGMAGAMASITYPGIWLGENVATIDATRGLARACNEYGAKMLADHPGRFGLFAVLPIPDVDGSLREIEYAFDTLKADGIGTLTSYGDKWLGDPAFAPVFEELNRRKAIVFTHANVPSCCTRGGVGNDRNLVPGVGNNLIEYGTDTTRAIMSLVVAKVGERYPNVRFTFSHAGGTMPFLVERLLGRVNLVKNLDSPAQPNTRLYQLRQFYYDTANANNPVALGALKRVVGASQILSGTDFPYEGHISLHVQDLQECGVFTPKELQGVFRENAIGLVPRLKTYS